MYVSLCTFEHFVFILAEQAYYASGLCSCHCMLHLLRGSADGAGGGDKLHWCFGPNATLISSSVDKVQPYKC